MSMWPGTPHQSSTCAKIFVCAPAYSNEWVFSLLMLVAPRLPSDCVPKLFAALVLLEVCAESVVVGLTVRSAAKHSGRHTRASATTDKGRISISSGSMGATFEPPSDRLMVRDSFSGWLRAHQSSTPADTGTSA